MLTYCISFGNIITNLRHKKIDFKNVNFLNCQVNILSGNFLPIATNNSRLSVFWRTYSIIVWLIQLSHTIALIFGIILAPTENSLKDGILSVVVTIEAFFMLTRLYTSKKLKEMIQKMNDNL